MELREWLPGCFFWQATLIETLFKNVQAVLEVYLDTQKFWKNQRKMFQLGTLARQGPRRTAIYERDFTPRKVTTVEK